jgi:diguanylate cyclase (GGDEF)-like protein
MNALLDTAPLRHLHRLHSVLHSFGVLFRRDGCRCLIGLLLLVQGITSQASQERVEDAHRLARTDPEAALTQLTAAIDNANVMAAGERVDLLIARASLHRDRGAYPSAHEDIARALPLINPDDDPVRFAELLGMKGSIAAEGGKLVEAMALFRQAHALLEPTEAQGKLAWMTNAIGMVHNFLGDQERAHTYFSQALSLARTAGDRELELTTLGNVAVAAAELEGPAAGIVLHEEALALANSLGYTTKAGYQLANLCNLQLKAGEPERALASCNAALDTLQPTGHARILAGTVMILGDIARSNDTPIEALEYYREALDLAADTVPLVEVEVLEKLADLSLQLARPAEAAAYFQRLLSLRESLREQEREQLVETVETRFALQQAQDDIDLLQLEALLAQEQLDRRSLLLGITAAALLAALVFVALMAYAYRTRTTLQAELYARNRELETAIDTIRELAAKDPLTGLFNRRAFDEISHHARARCLRDKLPMSLTIGDIDRFKDINDTYGHQIGDAILIEVARRITATLRTTDIIFRWGGEEFLCLHPATDLATAEQVMERVREALEAQPISTGVGAIDITMTFGIVAVGQDLAAAIQVADGAMYEGKGAGRNRIVVSQAQGQAQT